MLLIAATGITLVINKTPQGNAVKKEYIGAQQFLEDSFRLAQQIFDSGFKPTFLIALWRGGAQVGITATEYFAYKNSPIKNHFAVRVSAYNHNQLTSTVRVFGLESIAKIITRNDRLLLVDDVVDTGASVKTLMEQIKRLCGDHTPQEIKVASVYYKPNSAAITPDFYVHSTDSWLVFPHELEGLTADEITSAKGEKISQTLTGTLDKPLSP